MGDEVRAAYKKKVLEAHPDKGGSPEEFRAVQQAYEKLSQTHMAPVVVAPPARDRSRSPPRFNVRETLEKPAPEKARKTEKHRSTVAPGTVPQRIVETKPMKVCQSAVGKGRPSNAKKRGALSVASLWEKLTKMPPQERQAAICKLDASSRAELSESSELEDDEESSPLLVLLAEIGDSVSLWHLRAARYFVSSAREEASNLQIAACRS